jgi:NADH dehydrogenase [ubiquinone] 1 alpha subcomplex assembly factor 7
MGPLSVADYMASCLGHPQFGYYITHDPLGRAGDFTTAPEISQMFGELIGLWAAQCWLQMGSPEKFALVEFGPGRGTLAADALRAADKVPGFTAAKRLHLVETSPVLRARQAAALADAQPVWHDELSTVPAGPAIFIGNEFLDALPIQQLIRQDGTWFERRIDWDDKAEHFTWCRTAAPAAAAIAASIADRAIAGPTAALFIDYGYARSTFGDSFQALQNHKPVDPLSAPGQADLTAHVDFAAVARAAGKAQVHGPIDQGAFLLRLGIQQRAARLMAQNPRQSKLIEKAQQRLIGATEMGMLFKALAITSPGLAVPAGFENV